MALRNVVDVTSCPFSVAPPLETPLGEARARGEVSSVRSAHELFLDMEERYTVRGIPRNTWEGRLFAHLRELWVATTRGFDGG